MPAAGGAYANDLIREDIQSNNRLKDQSSTLGVSDNDLIILDSLIINPFKHRPFSLL